MGGRGGGSEGMAGQADDRATAQGGRRRSHGEPRPLRQEHTG